MQLLKRFNQVGTTMLIASHDIDLIESFGERQLILENGKLLSDSGCSEDYQ